MASEQIVEFLQEPHVGPAVGRRSKAHEHALDWDHRCGSYREIRGDRLANQLQRLAAFLQFAPDVNDVPLVEDTAELLVC